jgi:hypothetical protein
MHPVRTASEDILAYRAGSFRDSLPALLIGGFGLLFFLLALGIPREHSVFIGLLAVIGVGLAFGGAVGLIRSLGRSGIVFDRSKGNVIVWRGVLVRLSSKTRDLAAFDTVLLSPARVRKRHAAGIVYLVGLQGGTGEPLAFFRDEDYRAAHHFAADVAAFLRLPFTDVSGTEPVIRTVGLPDQPPSPVPAAAAPGPIPPAGMQCRVTWNGDLLVIAEPAVPKMKLIGGPLLLFLLLALPCLGYGTYVHFFETIPTVNASALVASLVVVVLLFLVFVGVVIVSMPHVYQRQVVEADRTCLRFKTVRLFATKDTSIRSEDVAELRIAFGHLTVVTPRELRVVCGRLDHPLPRAELEWLRQQLWRALKGVASSQ